jgi:hypothetical protein
MNITRPLLRASWQSWISNDNRPHAGPWWLQWMWTGLFATALAVPFTVLGFVAYGSGTGAWRNLPGWLYWYGRNLIVCLTISALIHLLFDTSRALWATPARVGGWKPWQRSAFFAGTPLVGLALGWPLGVWLAGADVTRWFSSPEGANLIAGSLLMGVVISMLFHLYFSAKSRQIDAERRATESQLRLLQAQIEPHFLFNTLANVQSLMDHDLPKARQLLASFTDYLRASLGALRSDDSTVAHELALARSYLELLQIRMEDRLRFSINSDDDASAQPLPPLLLQPLVENAVVHGLEPSIEGGSVQLHARVHNGQLVLDVCDDGRGLDAPPRAGARHRTPGHGLALANIRQRLLTRYGSAATLEVLPGQPGTLARITLPLHTSRS